MGIRHALQALRPDATTQHTLPKSARQLHTLWSLLQTPTVFVDLDNCASPNPSASPILDLRSRLHWPQRLPARLGTAALWTGGIGLLGPLKLAGVLVTGSLLAPCLLLLDQGRRRSIQLPGAALPATSMQQAGLPRALQAAELGLQESQLFRARHASVCTVHHDASGRILHLEVPATLAPVPVRSPDAHPVG